MQNEFGIQEDKKELSSITNVKDNSYDIELNGKTYHITLKKGEKKVYFAYKEEERGDKTTTTYHPFLLEVKSSQTHSFTILFSFRNYNFIDTCSCCLLSYNTDGIINPLKGSSHDIGAKQFYEKAFAEPFDIKIPQSFKETGINREQDERHSLRYRALNENISLETLVNVYLRASEFYSSNDINIPPSSFNNSFYTLAIKMNELSQHNR